LWQLDDRPMHTDEAVHAEKFKALLEEGFYAYDPEEFHGPTLYYFTLISAWLRGENTYPQINEVTLRIIPAVFGVGLILTPLFFLKGFNLRTVFFSSTLIAYSPAFIYYSRYYIQETLLLFFTASFLGCAWNYTQSRKLSWIILSGIFVGLMHATKETFIFSIIAAVLALIVSVLICGGRPRLKITHILWAVAAMILTSMLLYSSFGKNPEGILDSVKTYAIWAKRAGGQSHHIHPWYYYLDILVWLEFIEPIHWNEDGIVALTVIGGVIVFLKGRERFDHLSRFFVIYAFILTAIYSLIPYKTPWSMMSFLFGMALIAGTTASLLLEYGSGRWGKVIIWSVLFVYGLASPMIQSWALNFSFSSDPTNPYVYAHTDKDVFKMVDSVQKAVQVSGDNIDTKVYVISEGNDYWPFPWYLRALPQVGYWDHVDESVCRAPIILAKAEHQQELLRVLYTVPEPGQRHLYVPLFNEILYLRPGVEWNGFIRKDVWDHMQHDSEPIGQMKRSKETALESVPDRKIIQNLVKFSHETMNANFEIFIQHEDGTYAGRAARAAFNEVDRLETLLSHYIENSDVSRINLLSPLDTTVVDEDTIKCLRVAQRAYELTDGAFNITIGNLIEAWKREDSKLAGQLLSKLTTPEMLEIDREGCAVKMLQKGVNIDLGGIGKGYAVDAIARVLAEWGIKRSLIHGGASSILALDPPKVKDGWPIVLRNPVDESVIVHLDLANEVISCSGLQRGEHIINPFTGRPVIDRRACWVRINKNSALVDALSTAGMIMPISTVTALQEKLPNVSVMLLMKDTEPKGKIIQWGNWLQE